MPDFGFVGASYVSPSIYQDAQECINFYLEIDPTKQPGERGAQSLYPTPGLVEKLQLTASEVRGMRALSGGQWLIVVAGNTVYRVNSSFVSTVIGTLTTTSGQVQITDTVTTDNGLTAYIVDGVNRYTWIASSNTFATLSSSDGLWVGATSCDTIDNYVIYNELGTQNWAASDLGLVASTTGNYGSKDGSPDSLMALIADHRQVYLLGEVTTEVWVDVGNTIDGITSFPFQRVSGTSMQHGCAAPYSIARLGESFIFVSKDTRGKSIIGIVQGYSFKRVSTHAIEYSLMGVDVSNAIGYTYQIEGHEFYVVTFPNADLTWVFDLATGYWHKWLAWENMTGYHRHRSNCAAFFAGFNLVGDYANGKVYALDNTVFTDNGSTIRRLRRAIHLTSDLQRQFFDEFQIQFEPGVGLSSGQGEDPQAMLRWSNDGGSTWSAEHWVSIGKMGQYTKRAIWRRLGWSRDRVFEVVITDPIEAIIVSANLKATMGDN